VEAIKDRKSAQLLFTQKKEACDKVGGQYVQLSFNASWICVAFPYPSAVLKPGGYDGSVNTHSQ